MSAEVKKEIQLEIAHVLFIDIVGYSKLSINEQRAAVDELTKVVRNSDQYQKAEAAGRLIKIPTGDGMALVFYTSPEAPVQCAVEISRAPNEHRRLQLRMGVHSGPVSGVIDVNGHANLAGAGLNMAQRVMDCGDAGHILLSKHVAEDLEEYEQWRPLLHDLGACKVKHGMRVSIVNLHADQVGNPQLPKKFQALKKHSVRVRWAMAMATLLALAAIVAGIAMFSRYRVRSRLAVPEKSIAVLPFENLSRDPDNAYFAEGVQDEILARLAKVADLKVISRTSTQRYKSSPGDLPQIAKRLGVSNILEGSVQKSGDAVRVNVQLINALNDAHLWAEIYDRKLTDVFAIESEIATKIAATLQAKLTGTEQHAIASRPTENTEAHQLYLKGLYYWYKWAGPGFEKSRDYYQQAIELDPTYALAYAGLADYYGFAFANGLLPPEEKWARAEEETAKKALSLDPTLGEAYNPLAAAQLYYHRDWPGAERYFHRGIELNPNFAEMRHHYALCLVLFGRNEETLVEMQRAIELDPLSPRFNWNLGRVLFFMRQYDHAIDQYHKTLELDPNYAPAHEWLGYAYEKKGMHQEAIAEWSKALTLSDDNEEASILERTYTRSGFEAAVRALAQKKLERLNARTSRGEYVAAVEYVIAYMQSGDKEQAFVWLAKAVEERNRLALEIKINPIFDPLRGDPRFDALVQKIFAAK
jgi:TolB-like protein/class 3 adenylate cyclase/Tfp pilus assembly protein PilF